MAAGMLTTFFLFRLVIRRVQWPEMGTICESDQSLSEDDKYVLRSLVKMLCELLRDEEWKKRWS